MTGKERVLADLTNGGDYSGDREPQLHDRMKATKLLEDVYVRLSGRPAQTKSGL